MRNVAAVDDQPSTPRPGSITRRRFVAGLLSIPLIGAIYGFLIEPRRIVVSHYVQDADGGASIRMVQLSDLHLQGVSRHVRDVADKVNEIGADIIFLTGDMIDRADRTGELEAFLRLLDPAIAKFAILGNWEHWSRVDVEQLRDTYSRTGCRLLINESVVYPHRSGNVVITGMDDWTGGTPDLTAALEGVRPNDLHVMLAHSPVYRDLLVEELENGTGSIAAQDVTLVLSGHTHGGQIALLGWAPVRPAGSGRYVAGWYGSPHPPMYVSRGLGTSLVPVRFGAPPEIAVFDWPLRAG